MNTGDADLATDVGRVALPNPIMTASGTSGHGTELDDYGELSALGAVVVKSVSVRPWAGNPAPRVHRVGEVARARAAGTDDRPGACGGEHLGSVGGRLRAGRRAAGRRVAARIGH